MLGALEHGVLFLDPLRQSAGLETPFRVGTAAPGAGSGAGRIAEDHIHFLNKFGQGLVFIAILDLYIARIGALEAGPDGAQAAPVDIPGMDLSGIHQKR